MLLPCKTRRPWYYLYHDRSKKKNAKESYISSHLKTFFKNLEKKNSRNNSKVGKSDRVIGDHDPIADHFIAIVPIMILI